MKDWHFLLIALGIMLTVVIGIPLALYTVSPPSSHTQSSDGNSGFRWDECLFNCTPEPSPSHYDGCNVTSDREYEAPTGIFRTGATINGWYQDLKFNCFNVTITFDCNYYKVGDIVSLSWNDRGVHDGPGYWQIDNKPPECYQVLQ